MSCGLWVQPGNQGAVITPETIIIPETRNEYLLKVIGHLLPHDTAMQMMKPIGNGNLTTSSPIVHVYSDFLSQTQHPLVFQAAYSLYMIPCIILLFLKLKMLLSVTQRAW